MILLFRPSGHPFLDCYLQGKQFEIIEPVLPAKTYNDTVQVSFTIRN